MKTMQNNHNGKIIQIIGPVVDVLSCIVYHASPMTRLFDDIKDTKVSDASGAIISDVNCS